MWRHATYRAKTAASIAAVVALGIAIAGGAVVAFGGPRLLPEAEPRATPGVIPPGRPTPAVATIPSPAPGIAPSDLVIADVELPSLSDEEVSQAESILLDRLSTISLFEKSSYTISQVGPWVDEAYGVRGVAMVLSLSTPVAVSDVVGAWPYMSTDESTPEGYRPQIMNVSTERARTEFAGRAVQRFSAVIDLSSKTVVELLPMIEELPLPGLIPTASAAP